jgi:hypothetical protein
VAEQDRLELNTLHRVLDLQEEHMDELQSHVERLDAQLQTTIRIVQCSVEEKEVRQNATRETSTKELNMVKCYMHTQLAAFEQRLVQSTQDVEGIVGDLAMTLDHMEAVSCAHATNSACIVQEANEVAMDTILSTVEAFAESLSGHLDGVLLSIDLSRSCDFQVKASQHREQCIQTEWQLELLRQEAQKEEELVLNLCETSMDRSELSDRLHQQDIELAIMTKYAEDLQAQVSELKQKAFEARARATEGESKREECAKSILEDVWILGEKIKEQAKDAESQWLMRHEEEKETQRQRAQKEADKEREWKAVLELERTRRLQEVALA